MHINKLPAAADTEKEQFKPLFHDRLFNIYCYIHLCEKKLFREPENSQTKHHNQSGVGFQSDLMYGFCYLVEQRAQRLAVLQRLAERRPRKGLASDLFDPRLAMTGEGWHEMKRCKQHPRSRQVHTLYFQDN